MEKLLDKCLALTELLPQVVFHNTLIIKLKKPSSQSASHLVSALHKSVSIFPHSSSLIFFKYKS